MLEFSTDICSTGVLRHNLGDNGNNSFSTQSGKRWKYFFFFFEKKVYMGVSPCNAKESLCLFICRIFKKLAGLWWTGFIPTWRTWGTWSFQGEKVISPGYRGEGLF